MYTEEERRGMYIAADLLEKTFYDHSPLAKMIRTVADGGDPCEDCGYPLPEHDTSCVSRGSDDENS